MVTEANAGTYTVVNTHDNGCTSTASVTAVVNTLPVVSISGNTDICENDSLTLSASNGIAWNWTGPSGFITTMNSFTIVNATPADAGMYTVEVTDAQGCLGDTAVNVTVNLRQVFYADKDDDGYGDSSDSIMLCSPSGFYVTTLAGDCNDDPLNGGSLVHPGMVEICGNHIDDDCNGIVDEGCDGVLEIKVFSEGYYEGLNKMRAVLDPLTYPNLCDTLVVELHSDTYPYSAQYSVSGIIDVYGHGTYSVPFAAINQSFYLVLRHRNALETWSLQPVVVIDSSFYDFTNPISKAFGNNLADLSDGSYAMISGDVTGQNNIQDGLIDYLDYDAVKSAIMNFLTGYHPFDLNGDHMAESTDFSLIENNISLFVIVARP